MEAIISNYIGGEHQPPATGTYLPNYEPATGAVYGRIPDSGPSDVQAAVRQAQRAFPAWSAMPAQGRADMLRALASAIDAQRDTLAHAESRDNGKPVALARDLDIPRAAANLRFFADAITQVSSEAHVSDGQALNYTLRVPLGVVACISPWNLPLYLFTWKIAPALAAGNCVVAKPSEITPMTAFMLTQLCSQVGLPPGVLNVVHGTGEAVGAPLVTHPDVAAVSFTGSTRTGAEIARTCASSFKKVSLEMGGKNATLVFADAMSDELADSTLDTVTRAAFANQGQICLCGSRILVERSVYERFVTALTERVQRLRIGDPLDAATNQGALVSAEHHAKVLGYLELARQEGGRILCGGKAPKLRGRCADGWFVEPTLIVDLAPTSRTNQEEIFGPVATVLPFDSEAEAVSIANGTPYGLAASVFTQQVGRAHRVAAHLQAGIVWVNCWMLRDLRTPFGGVKQSGVGREGGHEALRFFTETKNVCIKMETA